MIAVASDRIGWPLKIKIMKMLDEMGLEYKDFGTYNYVDKVNYPRFGYKAARAMKTGECDKGIIFCGTGVGISLSANKVKGIRCCVCSDCYSAEMSKRHNNTNMLAFGSWVVGSELARMIVRTWLSAKFEGGDHQMRLDMITKIEDEDESFLNN